MSEAASRGGGDGADGSPGRLPPALLADATWYGTLAAVRDLGSHGVPVVLATDNALAPARWSRFATRTVRCPSTKDSKGFLEWLLAFGERHPGHVYYPTSDSSAWLAATHRESLSRHFKLFSPAPSALSPLLDKAQLTAEAVGAGLDVPDTWYPKDEAELERLAGDLPYPLVVKPRSQVFRVGGLKGDRIQRREDLIPMWRKHTSDRSSDGLPETDVPILQRCYPTSERIYTVDGFIDGSGELFATLGCTKLLQLPRSSGSGLVFEESPVHALVHSGLQRLLKKIGFYGVFDAEFLEQGNRYLLIDVNPRIYNHMDFEVKRGLPLAWLSYLGALGAEDAMRSALQDGKDLRAASGRTYAHRLPTRLLLLCQRLSGEMSRDELREWGRWLDSHESPGGDPTHWPRDPGPAVADGVYHLQQLCRHPRNFLRGFWRGVS